MVNGVHGNLDHVVRLVMEYELLLDSVTLPNLHVKEKNAVVGAVTLKSATRLLVRHEMII